jgi:hypothetical protein
MLLTVIPNLTIMGPMIVAFPAIVLIGVYTMIEGLGNPNLFESVVSMLVGILLIGIGLSGFILPLARKFNK